MNRNIRLFMAYRVVSRLYFHLPVLFLLFWSLHVDYSTVMLLLAMYSGASTIASDLAPALNRRLPAIRLVLLGEGMKSMGLALLVLGTLPGQVSMPVLVISQLIGGTGFALALAADSGLLRVVSPAADAQTLGLIQGRTQSMMFIATLVAGFIGGVLFEYDMHWALYAGMGASAMSMVVLFFIDGPARHTVPPPLRVKVERESGAPLRFKLSRNQTTWAGFYAITRAFALAPFIGLLPLHFALQQLDPYLFGIVLGLFTLGGFLVALWGAPVLAWLGPQGGVWLTFGGIAGSLTIFAASEMLEHWGIEIFTSSLLAISLLGIAAGAIRSVVSTRMDLTSLTLSQRMVVFARMERWFGYLSAFLLIGFGELVERVSITAAFAFTVLALLMTVVASTGWLILMASSEQTAAQIQV